MCQKHWNCLYVDITSGGPSAGISRKSGMHGSAAVMVRESSTRTT